MKELLLFRIFALFPFIGTAVPDLANGLHTSFSSISAEHIIVDITLSACLLICSAGIWALEMKATLKTKQDFDSPHFSGALTHEA